MGSIAMDSSDHDRYMKKTGLHGDKKYGNIQVYSNDADVVQKAAMDGLGKEDTIKAIILARKHAEGIAEFNKEMEERRLFEELKNKY